MTTSRTSLRSFGIEALVIVGSILLAFAIDAAWTERRESAEVDAALQAVRAELIGNRAYFDEVAVVHQRVADAGFEMLTLTGPDPSPAAAERVPALIGGLWTRAGLEPPGSGAVSGLIASGRIAEVDDTDLREALAEWPAYIDRQQELLDLIYDQNLFHQRLVLFVAQLDIDRLYGMGDAESAREAFVAGAPRASRLESDYAGLLSDLQFENGVTSRVTAALIGVDETENAQARIDALVSLIDRHLR